jgi:2-dehydro-3-deoxyphosphogluconate aldolase/(4S)-4-hydroxy-2-oxoglutarate aldolase
MDKLDAFNRIKEIGIIPAIRTSTPAVAVHAAEAIRQGGIPVIEVSFAPGHAPEVLEAVAAACGDSMIVGAGTIVDATESASPLRPAHSSLLRPVSAPKRCMPPEHWVWQSSPAH